MATTEYKSDFLDRIEARAEARALVIVLESRNLHLTDEQRDQVMTCTDVDTLERWLRRAGAATSADDVFKD